MCYNLKISIISNAQFYTPLLFDALIGKSLSELNICTDCAIWSYILKEGKPSQRLYELSANHLFKIRRIDTGLGQNSCSKAVLLQQCQQQVLRLKLLVTGIFGELLSGDDGGPGFFSELFRRGLHSGVVELE